MKEVEYEKEVKYKGEKKEINFLQEARYGNRGELTIAFIEDGENQIIEVSERSPVDSYGSNQGKNVAAGRLIKKLKKREYHAEQKRKEK